MVVRAEVVLICVLGLAWPGLHAVSAAELTQEVPVDSSPHSPVSSDALIRLAELYSDGSVVPSDLPRALDYYRQAAAAGSQYGQVRFGEMLARGQGAAQDVEAGRALVRAVAETGHAGALVSLGDLYARGDAGPIDPTGATRAYEKAASLGDARALMRLGDLYGEGTIVPRDAVKSIAAYERASAAGDADAHLRLGDLYFDGVLAVPNLSRALGHYRQAAAAGSNTGRVRAGEMLARGEGVMQDVEAGRAMVSAVAEAGGTSALVSLGDLYARGDAGPIDSVKAIKAYQRAADAGDERALMRLGDLHCAGVIVARNCRRALTYYQRAADAGNLYGLYALGTGYVDRRFPGGGSPAEGIALLQEAERRGLPDAVVALSDMYMFGDGVVRDPKKAIALLAGAMKAGNIAAARQLIAVYRDGRKIAGSKTLVRRNPDLARSYLKEIENRLSPADLQFEELLFDLASRSRRSYERLYEYVLAVSPADVPGIIREVRELNTNAYVYLLQARMSDLGLYGGRKDAQLTRATIRAISRFCQMKQMQSICGRGPLSGEAASVLGFTFRSANVAAGAVQSSSRDIAVSQSGADNEEVTGSIAKAPPQKRAGGPSARVPKPAPARELRRPARPKHESPKAKPEPARVPQASPRRESLHVLPPALLPTRPLRSAARP